MPSSLSPNLGQALALSDAAPREFDLDSYKILVRPIMLKTAVVEPVAS
jgi:hypothetical protein